MATKAVIVSPTPESRSEWARLRLEPEQLLNTICDHIASGGAFIGLGALWEIPWTWIAKWCRETEERRDRLRSAQMDANDWFIQRIADELKHLSTVDIRQLYDQNGRLKRPEDWPPDVAAAVVAIETKEIFSKEGDHEGNVVKVKTADKTRALELLGKYAGMFKERIEISGTVTVADGLKKARERAKSLHP